MWEEDPENKGRSSNWTNPSNPCEMAADDNYWEGGYNEKAMRAYAVRKLKEHTMKEWEDKKKSIIPESDTNIIFGGSNMKKSTFDTSIKPDVDALMMPVDGTTGFQPDMEDQSWNGIKWKRESGKYFAVDPSQGEYVPITRDQLATSFKINSRKYGYGSVDGLIDTSDDNNDNNNNNNNNTQIHTVNVVELKDGETKSIKLGTWPLRSTKQVRKMNGVWEVKGAETTGWVKASAGQIKRINKQYK